MRRLALLVALLGMLPGSSPRAAGLAGRIEVRAELIGRVPRSAAPRIPEAARKIERLVRTPDRFTETRLPRLLPRPPVRPPILHRRGFVSHRELNLHAAALEGELGDADQGFTLLDIEPRAGHPNAVKHELLILDGVKRRPASFDTRASQVLRTSLWTGARTEYLAESIGVTDVKGLNPRSATKGGASELATYLRDDLKVTDHADVADSFGQNYPVMAGRLKNPATLWRLFSTAHPSPSRALGRYYFCCAEEIGGEQWVDARGLATPPGNIKSDLAKVVIPAGTTVLIGPIADQQSFAALGGNVQIFVPHVDNFPYDHYKLKTSGSSPTDIIVQGDGTALRFGQ